MFPLFDALSCSPLPSSGSWCISAASSPLSSVLRVRTSPQHPSRFSYGFPWLALLAATIGGARDERSLPSSWGILVNTCPGLETPVVPLDLAYRSLRCCLPLGLQRRLPQRVRFRSWVLTARVLAVYASHLSGRPVKWQDSLPTCLLCFSRIGLSPTRFL